MANKVIVFDTLTNFSERYYIMEDTISVYMPSDSYIKRLIGRIKEFIAKYKVVITTTVLTALILDVITGIVFGFGGAALFALL